jgi:radical SAM superfamily enzyme YgiQ (UPF0313 family)
MVIEPQITFAFWPMFVRWNAGISQLVACCQEWGIESEVVALSDIPLDQWDPISPVVGFSCVVEEDYLFSIPYIKRAKSLGKTTILGGVWAGLGKPVGPFVDLVCRGDGEDLPIYLLGGDISVFQNKQVTRDIDSLPMLDYTHWDSVWVGDGRGFNRGHLPILSGKLQVPYLSSRGCNHKCSFCQVRYQPAGRRVRYKAGEELSILTDLYRPDIVVMADAQLPYDDTKWRESWGTLYCPFVAYIRADISESELIWLIDHGLIGCAFGVESGDEEFRNNVLCKGVTDADIERTIGILSFYDIQYAPFFMEGVPGDKWISRTRTISMIRKIGGFPIVWNYRDLGKGRELWE